MHISIPTKRWLKWIQLTKEVYLIVSNVSDSTINKINNNYVLQTQNQQVPIIDDPDEIEFFKIVGENVSWEAHFNIRGIFLGKFLIQIFKQNFSRS